MNVTSLLSLGQTALELGLICSLTVLALFLSYSMLNVCDLSTDGCFTLGAAVGAVVAISGHPWLAIFAAMLAGVCSGFVTALLQTRMGVDSLLAGIIVNTGLYSVNIFVMGGAAQLNLNKTETVFTVMKSLLADTDLVVKYINDFEDETFVGIVCAAPTVTETAKVDVNAKYVVNASTAYAAVAETTLSGDTLTAKAYRTKTEFAGYGEVVDAKLPVGNVTKVEATAWYIATADGKTTKYTSWEGDNYADVVETVSIKDDVYTISLKMNDSTTSAFASKWGNLAAGQYQLVIELSYNGVANATGTNQFTIFFEIAE